MADDPITFTLADGRATITLNRADVLNSLYDAAVAQYSKLSIPRPSTKDLYVKTDRIGLKLRTNLLVGSYWARVRAAVDPCATRIYVVETC